MRRALRACLVVLAVLGAGELLARRVDVPDPAAPPAPDPTLGDGVLLHGNPWLLWELIPGRRSEIGTTVTVNARGFRDPERGPKTRPRAMALGDSSVYGFGADDDEVFTALLEARMDADFVNAGVPGYSSYQAVNQLRARGLALEPDLLLVATLWSDNNFDSFSDADLLTSYAGWEASGVARARAWLERSALFTRLDWWLRVRPRFARARKVGWQVGGDDPRSGLRRVAIADYARNLDTLCATMEARGGGVVHVVLPNREDIERFKPEPAWAPYREAMRRAAERCGAPLVDLPAAFRASGHSADALFLDLMHPTPLGHRVTADAIEAVLRAADWPATPIPARLTDAPLRVPDDPFEGRGIEPGKR